MKLLLGILLLAVAAHGILVVSRNEPDDKVWGKYKETHGKKYEPTEDAMRKNLFMGSRKSVEEHYERYLNGKHSYFTELNKYSDWLPHEKSRLRGSKMSDARLQRSYTSNEVKDSEPGPPLRPSVDYRNINVVTSVKDQGTCGSDWAFAAVAGMETIHSLECGYPDSLSTQNILDCDYADNGCEGGSVDSAFKFTHYQGGLESDESYPYTGKVSSTCYYNQSKSAFHNEAYYDVPQNDSYELQKQVAQVGPVVVVINAQNLMDYAGGIYDPEVCDISQIDHAGLIVGYGVTDDGTLYWIIKNSWGADWGEDGYFRLLRGTNKCGVTMSASYPCGSFCMPA